jgi:hypothetical protein
VNAHSIAGFDVEGPVQAEVFVLFRDANSRLNLTGPCGADPWYLEVGADEDPTAVVAAAIRRVIGEPVVVHSTSWRRDRSSVVLSFMAVIDRALLGGMTAVPVRRAELARGGADTAPPDIGTLSVIEHGLRHLAWLVMDDPVVAERLDEGWRSVLSTYVPEPFRQL